jgi:hypothetical protein
MTFKPYLNEIEVKERTLRELASMATMESVKGGCILENDSRTGSVFDRTYYIDIRQRMNIVGEMRELFIQVSDKEALNWLSAISPDPAYNFNKYRRLEGTCEWIFRTQTYHSWMDGAGNRDLWVVGIPGKLFFCFQRLTN